MVLDHALSNHHHRLSTNGLGMKKRVSSHLLISHAFLFLLQTWTVSAYVVALRDGDIRMYSGRGLVVSTGPKPRDDPVVALHFGPYGRETASLISVAKSGVCCVLSKA